MTASELPFFAICKGGPVDSPFTPEEDDPLIQLDRLLALSPLAAPNPFQLRRLPSLPEGGLSAPRGDDGNGAEVVGRGGVLDSGIDSNAIPSPLSG
jgi:hypothetical protein